MVHRVIEFTKKDGNLILSVVKGMEEELAEATDIFDALEQQLCNGWERILPEECGALTDGLIITDDCSRNDQGELLELGRVYWDSDYAVKDALEELQKGNEVTFIGAD